MSGAPTLEWWEELDNAVTAIGRAADTINSVDGFKYAAVGVRAAQEMVAAARRAGFIDPPRKLPEGNEPD